MVEKDIKYFALSDYLIIFLSILFGYAISIFFSGWGAFIKNSADVKIYWLHLGWTILILIDIIETWWGLWKVREKIGKHIGYFFLVLLYPINFYLLGVAMFPDISKGETIIFKDYFYSHVVLIFSFLTIAMVYSLIQGVLLSDRRGPLEAHIYRIITIILYALGMFIKYEFYHIFIFGISALFFIRFIVRHRIKLTQ
jgi:hypothetical protein